MFGSAAEILAAAGPVYLIAVSWPLAKTDVRERRLPNKLVLPALPITLVGQLSAAMFVGAWANFGWSLGVATIIFLGSLLLNRASLLGMGDVKLMTVMALGLSWYSPLLPVIALTSTFMLAGIVAFVLIIFRRIGRQSGLPLGPYLLAGFFTAITLAVWS